MTNSHLVCFVTMPSQSAACELARKLVDENHVACVNVVDPVRSFYRWEGKLCDDAEALCIMKTSAEAFERMRARIVELHPYSVPEIIALPIVAGHAPYLAWLSEQVKRA